MRVLALFSILASGSCQEQDSLSLLQTHAVKEHGPRCYFSSEKAGMYIGGCVAGCKEFSTLPEAQAFCLTESRCGGVTKRGPAQGGKFEVRSGPTFATSPSGETSWLCGEKEEASDPKAECKAARAARKDTKKAKKDAKAALKAAKDALKAAKGEDKAAKDAISEACQKKEKEPAGPCELTDECGPGGVTGKLMPDGSVGKCSKCGWALGDGNGKKEVKVGMADDPEACIAMVKASAQCTGANAVTYNDPRTKSTTGGRMCFCEWEETSYFCSAHSSPTQTGFITCLL